MGFLFLFKYFLFSRADGRADGYVGKYPKHGIGTKHGKENFRSSAVSCEKTQNDGADGLFVFFHYVVDRRDDDEFVYYSACLAVL